ncbi:MAG TPA: biopolymer transporter ExbD [Cytophagales bacterium]|nr:biopolymer transporter ExbD [Cytophagales bacterium]
MNFRRKNKAHSSVEVSALNDIMFFLMLFFLIASTLANPNVIKLLLPQAKAGQTVSKQQYSLTVSKDLEYYINNEKTSLAFEQLESRLLQIVGNSNDVTVVLKVDRSIQVQNLVDILALGNKLKIKMILATQPPK